MSRPDLVASAVPWVVAPRYRSPREDVHRPVRSGREQSQCGGALAICVSWNPEQANTRFCIQNTETRDNVNRYPENDSGHRKVPARENLILRINKPNQSPPIVITRPLSVAGRDVHRSAAQGSLPPLTLQDSSCHRGGSCCASEHPDHRSRRP